MDILETERLILRPWKATDSKDFFEYAKSPTLGPQAGWKPHADEAESKKVIFDKYVLKAARDASLDLEDVKAEMCAELKDRGIECTASLLDAFDAEFADDIDDDE